MLSVQTNFASMVAQSSVNHNNSLLSTAMERLSTGLRINHASDDAAGLQIADRMNMNVTGMNTAKRNVSDAMSMLQTADGALDELSKIANRQKELATQAANGVNNADDKKAMNEEFIALNRESHRILEKTQYAGQTLFSSLAGHSTATASNGAEAVYEADGTQKTAATYAQTAIGTAVPAGVTFQIGAGKDEQLKVAITRPSEADMQKVNLTTGANAAIDTVDSFAKAIDTARSQLGANVNRLEHTSANLTNVANKTKAAAGRIMDADFATESAAMTKNQLLVQAGTKVLSHANQNTGLVMGLLG